MPQVSVIIPTHNRCDFVREAIASVVAQTYQDCEIIVVDDGSDDDTCTAVAEFLCAYPAVRYVFQANQGVSAARNHGVALSRGQFLAFLDSDDVWQPSKLESQIAFFTTHPEASICQTEEIWLRNGVRVNPHTKHRKASGDIFARSLELCLVSPSAVMLRQELFDQMGGFDPNLPACEDYDLWLRIAARLPIHLIDTPLVIKRGGHPDQLSHRFWGMDRFRVAALQKLLDSGVLSAEQRQLTLAVLRKKCAILVQGARKRGKTGEEYGRLAAVYADEGENVKREKTLGLCICYVNINCLSYLLRSTETSQFPDAGSLASVGRVRPTSASDTCSGVAAWGESSAGLCGLARGNCAARWGKYCRNFRPTGNPASVEHQTIAE